MNICKHIITLLFLLAAAGAYGQKKYERGVLLELYTGQTCVNCPSASEKLKNIVANHVGDNRLVWISHHAGYYPDSLTIKESCDLATFCGVSGAPTFIYNRSLYKFGTGRPKLCQVVGDFELYNDKFAGQDPQGRTFLEAELEQGADISIDMHVDYDETSRVVNVTVYGEKSGDFSATAPALSVFLVQDTYDGMQFKGLGSVDYDYHHKNPVRHMFSAHYLGDPVVFDGNGRYSMTYEYCIPEKIPSYSNYGGVGNVEAPADPSRMYIAAFVSNRDETPVGNPSYERGNISVLNAVKCPLGSASTSVPAIVEESIDVAVSGGRVCVSGIAGDYEVFVYTPLGRLVGNASLRHGIYVVRVVTASGHTFVRKVFAC